MGDIFDSIIAADILYAGLGNSICAFQNKRQDQIDNCSNRQDVFFTQFLQLSDHRTISPSFMKAKETEMKGFLRRATFFTFLNRKYQRMRTSWEGGSFVF